MVPVYIKGGAWTNIEDQILKAAVTKYGLNQWSRVASLLAKKTAKQCKARWQEYLDPRIDTTDWTPQEDDKLLNLARLRPNQWRSIAQSIGRTATDCVERYQKLLSDGVDEDEGSSELGLTGVGVEALKAVGASVDLKLGDLNVNPETKEARPDGEEFDDDEREMLAEAKARLANSKGKKATRKARERMLEESKRVAVLQKRRELKEAGVNVKLNAPKKKFSTQFDYNADIPFEHRPLEGPYDTMDEVEDDEKRLQKFEKGIIVHGLKEKDEAKGKKKKKRSKEEVDEKPKAETNDDQYKRRKLELSQPMFSLEELNELSTKNEDEIKVVLEKKNVELGVDLEGNINHQIELIKKGQNIQSALLTKQGEGEEEEGGKSDKDNEHPADEQKRGDKDDIEEKRPKVLSLKERLQALSKPKNDFEIVIDSEEDNEDEHTKTKTIDVKKSGIKVDAGERLRLLKLKREEESRKALLRRSQALQKNLPIPYIELDYPLSSSQQQSPLEIAITREFKNLVRSDYAKTNQLNNIPLLTDLDESTYEKVNQLVEDELNPEQLKEFQKRFIESHQSRGPDPSDQSQLITELQILIAQTTKLEAQLQKQHKGYLTVNDNLSAKNIELLTELKDLDRTETAFEVLAQGEEIAMKLRQEWLSESTEKLNRAERSAQEIYLELLRNEENEKLLG